MSSSAQQAEINKYENVYQHPNYKMGDARFQCARDNLTDSPFRGSYLDVGCGRGEMLTLAKSLGFKKVKGVEVVSYLIGGDVVQGKAWDLPFDDDAVEVVSLFDVIEHLLYEDMIPTLNELKRVASKQVVLTAANYSSKSLGQELHVNRLPYEVWDEVIKSAFDGCAVEWLPRAHGTNSETWVITL